METAWLVQLGESILSVFAIVNPIGNLPVFVGLTQDTTFNERQHLFRLAGGIAFVVILMMAIVGQFLLERVFHIGINEFAFGGGLLIMLLGIKSILFSQANRPALNNDPQQRHDEHLNLAISPIAVPLLCGPGSIVTVMLLSSQHGRILACTACLGAFFFVILILNFAHIIFRIVGKVGTMVIGRVMQIFIISIGVKFCFTALAEMFPSLNH